MNKVLEILNDSGIAISFNDEFISSVSYDEKTDTFVFWYEKGGRAKAIQVSRENIGFADWDEQEDAGLFNDPFYVFIDTKNTHHIVRFFLNKSLDIMQKVKSIL